jgi:hypothetical protein
MTRPDLTLANRWLRVQALPTGRHVTQAVSPLLSRWAPGAATGTGNAVVVSVTDFTAHRIRDLPGTSGPRGRTR